MLRLDPNQRLRDCRQRQVALALPEPLSARLDALLEIADSEGERTTRKELMAALILAAPESGAEISSLIRSYRLAVAEAAAVIGSDRDVLLEVRARPGPRSRKRSADV